MKQHFFKSYYYSFFNIAVNPDVNSKNTNFISIIGLSQKGISLAGAVVGMAMLSVLVSVIAGVIANTFNIMNRTDSVGAMENSHLSALYFLKNPKNFYDPSASSAALGGVLTASEVNCLTGNGGGQCSSLSAAGWKNVQTGSTPITVEHKIPNCTMGSNGATTCSGTVTITNTQDKLNVLLDQKGQICSGAVGGSTTTCWYEQKAQYQLRDCTSDSCGWVDVKLVTRPLTDSQHPPYNPNMEKQIALAAREVSFGFNKFAIQGGRTINFSCAATSGFASQIDLKTNKALCKPLNPTRVQNTTCTNKKRVKVFAGSSPTTACDDMPDPIACTSGYSSLTLAATGGISCR